MMIDYNTVKINHISSTHTILCITYHPYILSNLSHNTYTCYPMYYILPTHIIQCVTYHMHILSHVSHFVSSLSAILTCHEMCMLWHQWYITKCVTCHILSHTCLIRHIRSVGRVVEMLSHKPRSKFWPRSSPNVAHCSSGLFSSF